MRKILMAVATAFALLVGAQLTTRPAEAAALPSTVAANVLETAATAPAEYAQYGYGYRRGYGRRFYGGPRMYRRRFYGPRMYRRRFYGRPYGYRRFY